MNFTREPIIETIITPKDGHKLILRNSKGGSQEEYVVEAVEVVSFGNSLFFRSLERPKSFLVPVSDYEVIETKETRVVLKNATFERSIKIGKGREAKKEEEPAEVEQRLEKKRERKRHRRKKAAPVEEETVEKAEEPEKGGGVKEETEVSSSVKLIPPPARLITPPSKLISEKIAAVVEEPLEITEGSVLPEPVEEKRSGKKPRRKKKAAKKAEESEKAESKEEPPEEGPSEETESTEMNKVSSAELAETGSPVPFSSLDSSEPFGKIW